MKTEHPNQYSAIGSKNSIKISKIKDYKAEIKNKSILARLALNEFSQEALTAERKR